MFLCLVVDFNEKELIKLKKVRLYLIKKQRRTYDNKYWYLSIGIERCEIYEELTDLSLEMDLGLKDLLVCFDGRKYKNIKKTNRVRSIEKRLKQK